MKLLGAVAIFVSYLIAQEAPTEKKGKKPCCRTKEPSYDCGDGCGGCYKKYLQKLDFYHTKPVLSGVNKNWNYFFEDLGPAFMADDGVFTTDCHGGVVDS